MLAVLLSHAGFEVCALARPDRAKRIREGGITLLTEKDALNARIPASDSAADLGSQDLVVITVKSNNLPELAPHLDAMCGPRTELLFLMNGLPWFFFDGFGGAHAGLRLRSVDPQGLLARTIPLSRVIWGTIESGAQALPNETVRHTSGKLIVVGRPDGSERGLEEIATVFRAAGFTVATTARIRDAIWQKLQGNTSLNPVSALSRATGSEMMSDPWVRDLVLAIIEETRAVGAQLGLDCGPDLGPRLLAMDANAGRFKTSMLQDIERGRPLEIEAIVQAPVEIADHLGVPVPFTKAVLGLLRCNIRNVGGEAPVRLVGGHQAGEACAQIQDR
jgi:2-dehydropantoate 2-reductase